MICIQKANHVFLCKILLLVHAREGPIVIYGNYDIMV